MTSDVPSCETNLRSEIPWQLCIWSRLTSTAPILVISAKDDLYNTLPAAKHLAQHIPAAKLIVLDSGGHLMVGRGREVNGAIADFLEGIEPRRGKVSLRSDYGT